MAKKCLGCGKKSDNNLYACSACLAKINEARREAKLKWGMRKNSLVFLYKMGLVGILWMIGMAIAAAFLIEGKRHFPLFVRLLMIYPPVIGLLVYFILGELFARYQSKNMLRFFSDKNYYTPNPFARLKIEKSLGFSLLFVGGGALLWVLFMSAVIVFENLVLGLSLRPPLDALRFQFVYHFCWLGVFMGMLVGLYRYGDWVKGLER